MFQIVNTRTGAVVATRSMRSAARTTRDRLDAQYGAAVHVIRTVNA